MKTAQPEGNLISKNKFQKKNRPSSYAFCINITDPIIYSPRFIFSIKSLKKEKDTKKRRKKRPNDIYFARARSF